MDAIPILFFFSIGLVAAMALTEFERARAGLAVFAQFGHHQIAGLLRRKYNFEIYVSELFAKYRLEHIARRADADPGKQARREARKAERDAAREIERMARENERLKKEAERIARDAEREAALEAKRVAREREQAERDAERTEREAAAEAERVAREQELAERKAAAEAERIARENEKAQREAERAAREAALEAEREVAREAERVAREKEIAERKAAAEAERITREKELAERKAALEAERAAREKEIAERKAAAEAERAARENERAQREAERAAREAALEAERKAAAEAERIARENERVQREAERAAREAALEAERKAAAEAERVAREREFAERRAALEAERMVREKELAERKAAAEAERIARENERAQREAERAARESTAGTVERMPLRRDGFVVRENSSPEETNIARQNVTRLVPAQKPVSEIVAPAARQAEPDPASSSPEPVSRWRWLTSSRKPAPQAAESGPSNGAESIGGLSGRFADVPRFENENAWPHMEREAANDGTQSHVIVFLRTTAEADATMLAVNTACSLAGPQRSVCLIDLDLKSGGIARLMGLTPQSGLQELVQDPHRLDRVGVESMLVRHNTGVHVLTAPRMSTSLNGLKPSAAAELIRAASSRFTYVVVDMPMAMTPWTDAVLKAAKLVYLVTPLTDQAAHRTAKLLHLMEQQDLDQLPVKIVAASCGNGGGGAVTTKQFANTIGREVDHTLPDDSELVLRSRRLGVPAAELSPNGELPQAIAKMLAEDLNEAPVGGAAQPQFAAMDRP